MNITEVLIKVLDSGIGITKGIYRIILFIDDEFTLDRIDRKIEGPKPRIHILWFWFWQVFGKLEIIFA